MLKNEERRLLFFTRLLAISTLCCLAFSWKLWLSRPHYPLVPVWGIVPAFPPPLDYAALALLVGLLVAVVIQPRSRLWVLLVLVSFALLFLQDQSRLWPSFYQFFFLFLLLGTRRHDGGGDEARRTLAGMQFVLAAIYFWGGIHKLNPHFFQEEFPWFIEPLTGRLPFDIAYLPQIAPLAALLEVAIGVGLLTRRLRHVALGGALAMHLVILVCIGPLRGNWNNSAWIWGLTVALQVCVLFFRAPTFSFKTMFNAPPRYNVPQLLAVVLIGIMPVLNNVNLWDSALSFNVYTGNVTQAEIRMRPEAVRHLPPEIAAFVSVQSDIAVLNLSAWTLHEFNANPYPETRIFKAVLARVCSYLDGEPAYLFVREKSGWFFPRAVHHAECGMTNDE